MTKFTIPTNSTILSVVETLLNPEEYVRNALGKMHNCKKEYATAYARIGTTGEGKQPHYRIEYDEPGLPEYPPSIFGCFHGASHKSLVENDDVLRDEHWSSQRSTLDEIANLIGGIRKRRR